jgi:hypothetical protein
MTNSKFAGAMLRAVVAFSVAGLGVSAASAQSDKSMGGMQMAPGSKMDMKAKKLPAKKPAHHKAAKHHKSASK